MSAGVYHYGRGACAGMAVWPRAKASFSQSIHQAGASIRSPRAASSLHSAWAQQRPRWLSKGVESEMEKQNELDRDTGPPTPYYVIQCESSHEEQGVEQKSGR